MPEGTITIIRTDRGFGFITPDDGGQDVFFHSTAVAERGFEHLRAGQRVAFERGKNPRDPSRERAVNVRPS